MPRVKTPEGHRLSTLQLSEATQQHIEALRPFIGAKLGVGMVNSRQAAQYIFNHGLTALINASLNAGAANARRSTDSGGPDA